MSLFGTVPPADEEIEISLFGPGVGECVVVHLGFGDWLVVDSCLADNRPVALAYLDAIGLDASAVALVVGTHWDDDHSRGLLEVVSTCSDAAFGCSAALGRHEFVAFAEQRDGAMIAGGAGVEEFREILRWYPEGHSPLWLKSNVRVWRREGSPPREVWALSPSDESIRRCLEKLAKGTVAAALTKTRATELDGPNHVSVALWLSLGECQALLGADLEEKGRSTRGWSAILASDVPPARERAAAFKIPHHGADNAHDDRVWERLLVPGPHAALTPYYRGRKFRPTDEDRERIRARTPNGYITVASPPTRRRKRGPAVEKMLRNRTNRPVIRRGFGQVRFRAKVDDGVWSVELFGDAAPI